MCLMEIIEVNYKDNNYKNAEYIDINNILDDKKNYLIEVDYQIEIIYINDFFTDKKKIILDENFYELLKKHKNESQTRGDIAGKIESNKLKGKYKELLKDVKGFNKSGSRTKKDENNKFEWCNPVNSRVVKPDTPFYNKYEKEYTRYIKPIMKEIEKELHHYIFLPKLKDGFFNCYYNNIIFNRGLRSAIHKDARNKFKYSALCCFSDNPNFKYSILAIPDLNIGFKMKNNKSLLIFNSVDLRHSNNHINPDFLNDRYSVVFYRK